MAAKKGLAPIVREAIPKLGRQEKPVASVCVQSMGPLYRGGDHGVD